MESIERSEGILETICAMQETFLIEQSISCLFHDMASNNVTSCSPWGVSVTSLFLRQFHTFQHATHIIIYTLFTSTIATV